jgi:hypothetical protein
MSKLDTGAKYSFLYLYDSLDAAGEVGFVFRGKPDQNRQVMDVKG